MAELIQILSAGPVTSTGLLVFMLICLLTGRVIPYWQVKEIKDKLKAYEDAAPQLMSEFKKLIALQEEENERLRNQDADKQSIRGPYEFTRRTKPRKRPRGTQPQAKSPTKGDNT